MATLTHVSAHPIAVGSLPPALGGMPERGEAPKYFQVKNKIAAVLDTLDTDATVPTERDLAERFAVSRTTIRQAFRELRLEGRVQRRGRSTVVAGPKIEQPLALSSYTEGVRRQGRRPGRQLVTLDRQAASSALGPLLGVSPDSAVIHIERLLLADDERIGLESTYLPAELVPALVADFDPTTSLYAYLRQIGVIIAQADERIETVLASPREAALIGTSPALPMLLINRFSRDPHGRPVECVRTLYRGDRFSFTTHLAADTR